MKKRIVVISSVCVAVVLCLGLGYLFIPMEQKVLWKVYGEYKQVRAVAYTSPWTVRSVSKPDTTELQGHYITYKKDEISFTYPLTEFNGVVNDNTMTATIRDFEYSVHVLNSDYIKSKRNNANTFLRGDPFWLTTKGIDEHKGYIVEIIYPDSRTMPDGSTYIDFFMFFDDEIYAASGATAYLLERL